MTLFLIVLNSFRYIKIPVPTPAQYARALQSGQGNFFEPNIASGSIAPSAAGRIVDEHQ